mmetsp:Transcript_40860/g.130489  ORF Transcript_40860/g.130489 Transcript_40860/m.130489 type:complete len:259 (+) Transcript_40860:2042-2818(+)
MAHITVESSARDSDPLSSASIAVYTFRSRSKSGRVSPPIPLRLSPVLASTPRPRLLTFRRKRVWIVRAASVASSSSISWPMVVLVARASVCEEKYLTSRPYIHTAPSSAKLRPCTDSITAASCRFSLGSSLASRSRTSVRTRGRRLSAKLLTRLSVSRSSPSISPNCRRRRNQRATLRKSLRSLASFLAALNASGVRKSSRARSPLSLLTCERLCVPAWAASTSSAIDQITFSLSSISELRGVARSVPFSALDPLPLS